MAIDVSPDTQTAQALADQLHAEHVSTSSRRHFFTGTEGWTDAQRANLAPYQADESEARLMQALIEHYKISASDLDAELLEHVQSNGQPR